MKIKIVASALLLAFTGVQPVAAGSANEIKRTVLQQAPIPGTGLEMRVLLIECPPGVAAPTHRHPVVGINYILQGEAETAFGDEPPHTYHAGESFQDKAGVPHTTFRNTSQTEPLRFLVYYAIKPGEPTLTIP